MNALDTEELRWPQFVKCTVTRREPSGEAQSSMLIKRDPRALLVVAVLFPVMRVRECTLNAHKSLDLQPPLRRRCLEEAYVSYLHNIGS